MNKSLDNNEQTTVRLGNSPEDVNASFALFIEEISQQTQLSDWPSASAVEQNALVYSTETINAACECAESRMALKNEMARALSTGPGLLMIKGAIEDTAALDGATELFADMIVQQRMSNASGADHFAKAGSNDRIWNSLEKHCMAHAQSFINYYASNSIALVSEAWLGTGYQVTAQVNQVNPGGQAQSAHRDYHLGFMTPEQLSQFPLHVHQFSPMLTLQGAIAHVDMPIESGPTLYLPYSQLHASGYVTFTSPQYQTYFQENYSQIELQKGDAVFFNPALMHAAGENKSTNIRRLANLLQISSALGRATETVDRVRMLEAVYPALSQLKQSNAINDEAINNVLAATAEGYSFPTNLDTDPPIDGLAPRTQFALAQLALRENFAPERFNAELRAQERRRQSQAEDTELF